MRGGKGGGRRRRRRKGHGGRGKGKRLGGRECEEDTAQHACVQYLYVHVHVYIKEAVCILCL